MDEQAIENEWRSLFREREALGRRLNRVSLSLNRKLQIEDLFQKIENSQIEYQRSKLNNSEKENQLKSIRAVKPMTSFKNFDSLDLQVAEIIDVKKVKKTKKLMELKVKLRDEVRTIVSGIANDFKTDELIGKKVTLLTNLAPRTLKGVESNGMILLGENEKGNFIFVSPEDKNIPNGTPIS